MGNQNHAFIYATVQPSKERKTFKTFGNEILSPRNKDHKFLNLTFFFFFFFFFFVCFFFFFSFAPTLSPYSYVSDWNFPKIGNEFK